MANLKLEDLLTLIRIVEHYKGKYIKDTLTTIEQSETLTPIVRKAVLDGFNSYARDILRRMGYTVEV